MTEYTLDIILHAYCCNHIKYLILKKNIQTVMTSIEKQPECFIPYCVYY